MGNGLRLIGFIIISEIVGAIGSIFTTPSISSGWYATLNRPEIAPPNWVFGPVWTTLFALMGIALFLIWKKETDRQSKRKALTWFTLQFALNILWSALFFGLQSPGAAFVEIIFLWLSILVTIVLFSRLSKVAAWLLVPYILWVSFAAYLNFMFWSLN